MRSVDASPTTPAAKRRLSASGSWETLPKAPFGWYRPEGAHAVRDRLVVVAGSIVQEWDPKAVDWRVVAEIKQAEQCEGCGYSEVTAWTGDELLLWGGGFSYRAPDGSSHSGVSVDLDGAISPLPEAPIEPRWWHTAVWSGSEMLVWGGACGRHECRDGGAYNPTTQQWRMLAPAPLPGYGHTAIWTGREMIVWGGSDDHEAEGRYGFPRSFLNEGAAYDPRSDSWRTLAPSSLEPRAWHSAVWTGKEMIVWGGVDAETAGAYNPRRDSWRRIPFGPLSDRVEHSAVWTGEKMIVWGGSPPGGGLAYADGAAFNPDANAWQTLPRAPIAGRYRHQAVWMEKQMYVWGGAKSNGWPMRAGASFRFEKRPE